MTQQQKPRITIDVVVKTRAEVADGYVLELDIPKFQSQYPTKVTRVPTELAVRLPPGTATKVTLERQRLRKEGADASKLYNFYWGLLGIAGAQEPEEDLFPPETVNVQVRRPQNAPSGAPAAQGDTQGANGYQDPARASIEAQTAVKAAVELIGHIMPLDVTGVEERLALIDKHFARLTMIVVRALHEAQEGAK